LIDKKKIRLKPERVLLYWDHGVIETPILAPAALSLGCAGVHQRELKEDITCDIILGNTYHLYLSTNGKSWKSRWFV
jgi:tRNA-guanine family transglycosylase